MKIAISLILCLAAAGVSAAELEPITADAIKTVDAPAVPAPRAAQEKTRGYQNVFMQIRNQPEWGAVEANDFQLRVDISVRKVFNDQYDMFNRVDNETQMGSIRKVFNSDWQLSGYGAYLDMREFAGSYTITGSVPGAGAQSRYVNLNVSKRFDDFSYYVSGFGMNLSVDRYGVNGSYDPDQFSKQAFTAVLSMIFAAQADKSQPVQP
jgi:hypothetical protein